MPLPSVSHPIWEKLMSRKVRHQFSLFAANMAIDHAARAYQADTAKKLQLAGELHNFFSKYEKFTAPELERLMQ
jgi:hypothetical protein